MAVELWTHQREGVERAFSEGSYGWFFEAGTGKTRTAIETLRKMYYREGRVM